MTALNFTYDHRLVKTYTARSDGSEDWLTYGIHEVVFYENGDIVVDEGPIDITGDDEKSVKSQVNQLKKVFDKDVIVRRIMYGHNREVKTLWQMVDVRMSKCDSESLRGLPVVEEK